MLQPVEKDHLPADEHPSARKPVGEHPEEGSQMSVDPLPIDGRAVDGRERVRHG